MSVSASWRETEARAPSDARQRAFRKARRHSRTVRLLRVLLPLAALAGVAVLFVLARLGLPIPFDLSAARLSITPNAVIMERPNLTGFDGEEREYSVMAERAIQSLTNPDRVRLESIRATVSAPTHGLTTVTAGSGQYDHAKSTLRLEGNVAVDSAEGYALRMTDAEIDFDAGTMQSAHPITVIYADSEISGQRFIATGGGRSILLEGGVRTTIMPPNRQVEPAAPEEPAE